MKYEELRAEVARAGLKVGSVDRFERAQAERRLGELAEQRGDVAAAIVHYRPAVAGWSKVGIRRRLAELEREQR